jgi:hypothetical protein
MDIRHVRTQTIIGRPDGTAVGITRAGEALDERLNGTRRTSGALR